MKNKLDLIVSKHMYWFLDQYSFRADSLHESFVFVMTFADWMDNIHIKRWSWYEEIKKHYPRLKYYNRGQLRRVYALL